MIPTNLPQPDRIIILTGECEVEYNGRATSYLPLGNRVTLIKPDSTIAVYGSTLLSPRNYQPAGCTIKCEIKQDHTLLEATRSNPDEKLTIRYTNIQSVNTLPSDDQKTEIEGTESDFHEYLKANPSTIEAGLSITGHEVDTTAGRVDLTGVDNSGNKVVIEVKRSTATLDSVSQLERYVNALTHRGILVCPSITQPAKDLLKSYGHTLARCPVQTCQNN